MRMRRKRNLGPRMAACADLLIEHPEERSGCWRTNDPQVKSLYIELGCGKGGFTVKTAAAHPDCLIVAVERVPDALIIAMERAREAGLTNILFINGDAARLNEYFAPDEADLIYINFCDPWPPARTAKRRLTHPKFLQIYAQVLAQHGELQFKTDNNDLFEWSLHQFPKAGFTLTEVTRDRHADGICGIMTDYEQKFHAEGVKINYCTAVK